MIRPVPNRPRPVEDRLEARIERLTTLQVQNDRGRSVDGLARDARARLWDSRPAVATSATGGLGRGEIVLRAGLLLRGESPKSPLLHAHAPRSAAVQVLLLALFAAQSRPARDAGHPTPLPLRDASRASTSWRYLVALATTDTGSRSTASRTPTENRLAQLRTALTRLHKTGRVELSRAKRGRFEGFRLLDESTYDPGEAVYYTLPRADELVVRVPVEFFLNGWVHALNDHEIATYLYLLFLQQNSTRDADGFIAVPRTLWGKAFDKSRGHIGYRMLSRFGLIRVLRQDVRRNDGTIERITDLEHLPNEPMRFVVDVDQLAVDALDRVLPALAQTPETRLDEASVITQAVAT